MSLISRLARLLGTAAEKDVPLEPRRERREEARERHRTEGEPAWPEAERHLNPEGEREVSDLVPNWPGAGASRRVIRRRR